MDAFPWGLVVRKIVIAKLDASTAVDVTDGYGHGNVEVCLLWDQSIDRFPVVNTR